MGLGLLILIIPLAILIVVVSALLQSWAAASKKMNAIPGNLGWPIVGETFAFITEFSSPAGVYNVFITGSEASKILLTGKDGMVSLNLSYAGRQVLGPTSLLHQNGEAHKRLRRLIGEPLSVNALKKYFNFINTLAIETLDQWAGKQVLVLEEASTVEF